MPGATFTVEMVEGVAVVAAPEEIDIANAADLLAALFEAASDGNDRFVVDMTQTRFCDSSGISALVTAHRRALEGDSQLLLAVSAPAIVRLFGLTGIDELIPSFATLPEALEHAGATDRDH